MCFAKKIVESYDWTKIYEKTKYIPYPSTPYSPIWYSPLYNNNYNLGETYDPTDKSWNLSTSSVSYSAVNNIGAANSITGNTSIKGLNSSGGSELYSAEVSEVSLGTEFGKAVDFKTNNTTFERGDTITTIITYYDNKKNLEKKGIVFKKHIKEQPEPNAFPQTFCKPPKDWK